MEAFILTATDQFGNNPRFFACAPDHVSFVEATKHGSVLSIYGKEVFVVENAEEIVQRLLRASNIWPCIYP